MLAPAHERRVVVDQAIPMQYSPTGPYGPVGRLVRQLAERGRRCISGIAPIILFLCWGLVTGCSDEPSGDPSESLQPAAGTAETSDRVETARAYTGNRSVAQRLRDASLEAEVMLALLDARDLRVFEFTPIVTDGRVVLQGHVETRAQRDRAATIAGAVNGIEAVINEVSSTEAPSADEMPLVAENRSDDDEAMSEPAAAESAAVDAPESEAPAAESAPPEPAEEAPTYHTVESGDNLWDIARAYDVSVQQITQLNDLGSNSIRPGQRLQVK